MDKILKCAFREKADCDSKCLFFQEREINCNYNYCNLRRLPSDNVKSAIRQLAVKISELENEITALKAVKK